LFFSSACNDIDDADKQIELTLKSKQIIEADNEFGLDIFSRIIQNESEDNFMVSPLSISIALSMAYNGAENETKAQMAKILKVDKFTRDELNQTYKQLLESLGNVDSKVTLDIANSIWYRDTYPVEKSFLEINNSFYNAEVNAANFNDAKTVDRINNWVSDKTNEKIPEIIDNISAETVMFIINAIYFYGNWATEFNAENTTDGYFNLNSESQILVDMMKRVDTVNYLLNETFAAIELPYGKGKFNMMLMLPNEDKTVNDLVDQFDAKNWKKWQNEFEKTNNVDISLPKFKIEYEVGLNPYLKAMGMEDAFTRDADFMGINTNKDLFISDVKHKTFVEVDEEGTEAAAVTVVEFGVTSVGPEPDPQYVPFHCTRPFLFAITEKDTGAILFMGKVGRPEME
jgi:serpin B